MAQLTVDYNAKNHIVDGIVSIIILSFDNVFKVKRGSYFDYIGKNSWQIRPHNGDGTKGNV
ncbi:MAG: hypothetical protein LBC89_03400 [Bacteroidales bacterium]|jgi:hypothetical protein|nr:hypothetical protein [Bacteroidales bacterium]